jgi:glucose/arabinose dehydrogenase
MRVRLGAVCAAAAALTAFLAVPSGARATTASSLPTATNGHRVQLIGSGLIIPTSFAVGDGTVFAADGGYESSARPDGGLYLLKGGSAVAIPTPLNMIAGIAWHDGALYGSGGVYTASGQSWRLYRWTGWSGTTFATRKLLYTAPKKFDGFNGLGFGADGRLFVGVDAGLTDNNDHGPASTSPYLYEILSFKANGTDRRTVARGIRQPWQMVFPAGSNSPFVTDLGQDTDADHPPDFILRVKAGQNYGFPKCNHLSAAACAGYARPFESFPAHTDLMGIGLYKSRLYVSSYQGPGANGPGGEVFSLPVKGGPLKPLIKGFTRAVVGLTVHGDELYVGSLSGQIFRLRL